MTNKPKAYIFAGANASGKSTLIAHLLQHKVISGTYVNPDLILKHDLQLPETNENYIKAFEEAKRRRSSLLADQKDIILETVFSTQDKLHFLQALKNTGYHITLFFTSTDTPHINALYLTQRVLAGGHDVPIHKLISRRERGFQNIKKATPMIDCLIYLDNSVPEEPPQIIMSLYNGILCYTNEDFERDVSWHHTLIENIDRDPTHIDPSFAVQQIDFCHTIQKSVEDFSKTLSITYMEKNMILTQEHLQ